MFERFGLTSRLFFFWFLSISVVCIFATSFLSYFNAQKALRNEFALKLTAVNHAVENNIVTYFQEKRLKFEALGDNSIFERDRKDLNLVTQELERIMKTQGKVYDLFIVDATGKIIVST